jgi:hypothetical protein
MRWTYTRKHHVTVPEKSVMNYVRYGDILIFDPDLKLIVAVKDNSYFQGDAFPS